MPINRQLLQQALTEQFPKSVIELTALVDDDNHWAVTVQSAEFRGLSRVQQHQLVYTALEKSLGEKVGGNLHALQLKTIAL